MPSIPNTIQKHNAYVDSLLESFTAHLRAIVQRAQGRTIARLQASLAIRDGVIAATPGNLRQLRGAGKVFLKELDAAGYERLAEAFAGEFPGTLPYLRDTIAELGRQAGQDWKLDLGRPDLDLLAAVQANTVAALDATIEAAAGAAVTRSLFGVAGMPFGSLVELLADRIEPAIGRARTIADTSISNWYATASDRAYRIIAADVPEQVLRYEYSGPVDKLERPFCRHLTDANKAYTRAEIDKMDNGSLPNVMISRGGFNCRHFWVLSARDLETPGEVVPVDQAPAAR